MAKNRRRKVYYTNQRSNNQQHNNANTTQQAPSTFDLSGIKNRMVKAVIKHSQIHRAREIMYALAPVLGNKLGVTELQKSIIKDYLSVKPYFDEFKKTTVKDWKQISGLDYTKSLAVPAHENPNYTQLASDIMPEVNDKKIKTNFLPFVLNENEDYENLINCPKRVVYQTAFENVRDNNFKSYIIRRILEGEYNGEKHLFVSDIVVHENYPKTHISLHLLVNGKAQGIMPLMRYDNCGHASVQTLKQVGLADSSRPETTKYAPVGGFTHLNRISPYESDSRITQERVTQREHVHLATKFQSQVFSSIYCLQKMLKLPHRINAVSLSAAEVNCYTQMLNNEHEAISAMEADARMFGGTIPISRIAQFADKYINNTTQTHKTLTPDFTREIDLYRSHLHQGTLPQYNNSQRPR